MQAPEIRTVGELRRAEWRSRSVKSEMRENLLARLRAGTPVFPGLVGYDDSVVPELINAILAQQDILLLGLRGQAKTRILRSLPQLLDEWMPVVSGVELWDDPLQPQLRATRRAIEIHGDDTPIRWVHRDERYHEKLATPDVTIADLLGEVDLIKHAEGRYLADESTMHFGLVPRSNRGIFAINELPDLAPRIQVGLFNVLEERDVQIRGYPVRLSLDLVLVFSANPEDYTNRGRIVTPLKDRIGSVIRTHYPLTADDAMRITRAQARLDRGPDAPPVLLLPYVHEIIEETVRLARCSPHVNQQSGVSVRTSIAALEAVVASAERRAVTLRENAIVPRISDLDALPAACRGKVELLLAESEEAEEKLIRALVGEALKNVSEPLLTAEQIESLATQFVGGKASIEVGDNVDAAALVAAAQRFDGLIAAADKLNRAALAAPAAASPAARSTAGAEPAHTPPLDAPAVRAAAIELILEALHVRNKLSKYTLRSRTFYKR